MNIIYTHAYLSIICLWIFNMILTRYSRDCRLFVFKVRDDTFVVIVYPFLLLSLILEAVIQELQFQSLTSFARFIMDLNCAMTLCRFIIGKMSRQARNDIADMSAEHQKIRDCTEGELRAMFVNADAHLEKLRKEFESLSAEPVTKSTTKKRKEKDLVPVDGIAIYDDGRFPVYIERDINTHRQILLIHSEWFGVFKAEMLRLSKSDPLYQNPNGPIIFPTRSGNFFAERYYGPYTIKDGPFLKAGIDYLQRFKIEGYQWRNGHWETVIIRASHPGFPRLVEVNEALISYLCHKKGAVILEPDSVANFFQEYRRYIVTPTKKKKDHEQSVSKMTCVGVEDVQEIFHYDNYIPILISKNVPYDTIMMVPNGWWNEFKHRMTTVYKTSRIYDSEFGPLVIPTYGEDVFAEHEYTLEISSDPMSAQIGMLTVYGYKWDPKVHTWNQVPIVARHCSPDATEMDISKALYHHLTVKRPTQVNMRQETDVPRIYGEFEQNIAIASGAIRAMVGDAVEAPLSREIICKGCEPLVDRAGVQIFIPSENDKKLVIMNKVYINQIIVPVIKLVLGALNTGIASISKYFNDITFISVNEGLSANLDFAHRTEDGHLEQLFTWPASPEKFDGPLIQVIRYEPSSNCDVWFTFSQVPTVVTSQIDVISRQTVEQYINDEINKLPNDPIINFLDFAFEHIPFIAPNASPAKSWRVSLITQECFDQLKANTSILREHYFVDEKGKSYLFKDGDGHEEFYNALRNRLWCVVPSTMSVDFELSADTMRWVHHGEMHKDANVRLTAFKCYRLTYETRWVEEWQPFVYEVNTMDELGIKIALLSCFLDFPKQPRCFSKLSDVMRHLLPEEYHKFHNSIKAE